MNPTIREVIVMTIRQPLKAAFTYLALCCCSFACITAKADDASSLQDEGIRILTVLRLIADEYINAIPPKDLLTHCVSSLDESAARNIASQSETQRIMEALEGWSRVHPNEPLINATKTCFSSLAGLINKYSEYYDKRTLAGMRSPQRQYAGLGIYFTVTSNGIFVNGLVTGGPADRAGIKKGAILAQIDGQSLAGMNENQVVNLMRGEVGSQVRLIYLSGADAEPKSALVSRDRIAYEPVQSEVLPANIVLMRVNSITYEAPKLLSDRFAQLQTQIGTQGLNGIILDLRGNMGGQLHQSAAIAAAFLQAQSAVFETRGRTPSHSKKYSADPKEYFQIDGLNPFFNLPSAVKNTKLVVLVNRMTAGGAEAIAAALQDQRRALVIGERTFGKGLVETFRPIHGGDGLKFTTASIYRTTGAPIEGVGVIPDMPLETAEATVQNSQAATQDAWVLQAIRLIAAPQIPR